MSNKYTSVYDWLKYIKANVVGINLRELRLNVFNENALAKQCYEKVGFVERKIDKDVFAYKDELWSRCNMIISKQLL